MFLFIPLGHDRMEARRLPWVTLGILGTSLVMLLFTESWRATLEPEIEAAGIEELQYWRTRPYLELQPLLGKTLRPPPAKLTYPKPLDPAALGAEQAELDRLATVTRRILARHPYQMLGWKRVNGHWWGILTYQFVHAGWLHFLFNGWFLWLTGCNLEDRWGRWVYLGFYLVAGVVAALVHGAIQGPSQVALVGASGAIAGAMGAFLVVQATARLRFGYLLWLFVVVRAGTFRAPALLVLPIWLGLEFLKSRFQDGVAHWAHIGGFLFGLPFALALRYSGTETKLDALVEDASTTKQDARILAVDDLIAQKQFDAARQQIALLLLEQPQNVDVQLTHLRLAQATGEPSHLGVAYAGALRAYLAQNMLDTANQLLVELRESGILPYMAQTTRLELGDALARRGLKSQSTVLYASLRAQGLDSEFAVRGAIAEATILLRAGRQGEAAQLLEAAEESPFCTPELDDRIAAQRTVLVSRSMPPGEPA